jgi:multidrug efflux pump subunit AcrA (membrane-fusion protein)
MSHRPHRSPIQRRSRWRRAPVMVAVMVVASVAAMMFGRGALQETGPRLLHAVTRGDLVVTVTAQGTLESARNEEIKCKVRGGEIPILWVIPSGTEVKPGDELVKLGSLDFEDRFNEVSKRAHMTRSEVERSKADVASAELAISEYLEGRYRTELMTLEKDLAIAESSHRTAQNMLDHAQLMAERGYVSDLELEEKAFAVIQARLNVDVKKTEIEVLQEYSKSMQLALLNGNLNASKAKYEADKERADWLAEQVDFALDDIKYCVVKAETSGMVILPSSRPWEHHTPRIQEGETVYMGQTLLLMPDLTQMQVKIGVHQSRIGRITPGLPARVVLPDMTLDGEVSSVASMAEPAGEWNGNVVKYDTTVALPSVQGLKPGMSAEVEVIVAQYTDVLTVPVAAVVEADPDAFCWVRTAAGVEQRAVRLGDTNDRFTVVEAGLQEGDEVVLHPFAFETARALASKSKDDARDRMSESAKPAGEKKANSQSKSPEETDLQTSKPKGPKPEQEL